MKHAALAGLILLLAASSALAGDLGAISDRGGNTVTIFSTGGPGIPGIALNKVTVGTAPFDVQAVPALNEWWVSNTSTDDISIIDKFTFAVVATIDLTSYTAGSPYGLTTDIFGHVYVACENTGTQQPMVIQFEAATRGYVNDWTFPGLSTPTGAEDIIWKDNTGKTGFPFPVNGEIFITVPGAGVTDGFVVGHLNLDDSSYAMPFTPPFVQNASDYARQLSITPDTDRIYVGGYVGDSGQTAFGNIDIGTYPPVWQGTGYVVLFSSPSPTDGTVIDELTPNHTGYITTFSGFYRVDVATDTVDASSTAFAYSVEALSYHAPTTNDTARKIYGGHQNSAGAQMEVMESPSFGGALMTTLGNIDESTYGVTVGPGAYRVDFLPPNAPPIVDSVTPTGGPAAGGRNIYVQGSGFVNAGLSYFAVGVTPVTPTYVDNNTIILTAPSGAPNTAVEVVVENPDRQYVYLPGIYTYAGGATIGSNSVTGGTSSSDYRMIFFPGITYEYEANLGLTSAFGPYDPYIWRAWKYIGGVYQEWNPAGIVPDAGGDIGIWLLARDGGMFMIDGWDVTPGTSVTFMLQPGWNIIGAPFMGFPDNQLINNVLVDDDLINPPAAEFLDMAGNVLTSQGVYDWDGTAYSFLGTGAFMQAGRGYWINNLTAGPVYITFDGTLVKPGAPIEDPVIRRLSPGEPAPPPPPGAGIGELTASSDSNSCSATSADSGFALLPVVLLVLACAACGLRRRRALC